MEIVSTVGLGILVFVVTLLSRFQCVLKRERKKYPFYNNSRRQNV